MNKKYESDQEFGNECLIDYPYTTTMSNKTFFFIIALVIITSIFHNDKNVSTPQPTKPTILLACYDYNTK